MRISAILFVLIQLLPASAVAEAPAKPAAAISPKLPEKSAPKLKYDPTSCYTARNTRGWTVRVHRRLLDDSKEVGNRVLDLLDAKLYDINRAVPAGPLKRLHEVPIWVELDNPGVKCMCYHPSRDWLEEHGFNPEKAGSVELGNAANFLDWSRIQPSMVLHELAHAYHHQVLGWDHGEIAAAYQRAVAAKSYQSVLYYPGHKKRAYALNDAKEYFAELTEAWFGTNDFYPFVRPEVLQHDPEMAKLLKKIWGE